MINRCKKLIWTTLILVSFQSQVLFASADPCEDPKFRNSNDWSLTVNLDGQMTAQEFLVLLEVFGAPGFRYKGMERIFGDENGRLVYFSFDPNKLNWPKNDIEEMRRGGLDRLAKKIPSAKLECVTRYGE